MLKEGAAEDTAVPPETAPFQPPSVQEVAALFPHLEILGFLGKGGMGAVYKARQPALDRVVALKILPAQVIGGTGFAERFNREARALAKLSHANIVGVHEFGQVNGQPFFIMEFVDGLTLRELERAGKLSPREALQIVPQICEALQFAHDEGIVHRDIKPENILLDKKGRVKIADFGIAKIMGRESEAGRVETQGAIGTPHYMAPEQVERPQEVDHRADIFSLGVVFYEMLTGELPLGKFAPPSRKVEVDVRLDEVVLRALEKEPARRYQEVNQVKTAVETIADSPAGSTSLNHDLLVQQVLSREFVLNVGSCLERGWALVKSDFWPIVGVTALILLLVQAATSTAIGIVAGGPLMGGLWLYFLKRVRGEHAGVETGFVGFQLAFPQLFLVGLLSVGLTVLGFLCLILPGIYLSVAWMFAFLLVVDQGMKFWPAMELSRKVVTRHFWPFFGFWLVLLLMNLGGALLCGIGLFLTLPITFAATAYAYQDIFAGALVSRKPAQSKVLPSGTEAVPGRAVGSHPSGERAWKFAAISLALLAMAILLVVVAGGFLAARDRARAMRAEMAAREALQASLSTAQSEKSDVESGTSRPAGDTRVSPQVLSERLEAAEMMDNLAEKDRALTVVSTDAASAGEADTTKSALGHISNLMKKDQASQDSALLLSHRGLRTQALEIARLMSNIQTRDRTFSSLATDAASAGEVEVVTAALGEISDMNMRDQTVHQSMTLLANRGLRKQAIDLARNISNTAVRDRALSELAQ
jgi:predicted Ser/Thr protein kinase